MPIYEYECPLCGRFELIQKASDAPLTHCPATCQKAPSGEPQKIERVVSAAAFHLKGSGWYKTDYTNTSSTGKGAATATGAAAPSSGGTESAGAAPAPAASGGESTGGASGGGETSATKAGCATACGCH